MNSIAGSRSSTSSSSACSSGLSGASAADQTRRRFWNTKARASATSEQPRADADPQAGPQVRAELAARALLGRLGRGAQRERGKQRLSARDPRDAQTERLRRHGLELAQVADASRERERYGARPQLQVQGQRPQVVDAHCAGGQLETPRDRRQRRQRGGDVEDHVLERHVDAGGIEPGLDPDVVGEVDRPRDRPGGAPSSVELEAAALLDAEPRDVQARKLRRVGIVLCVGRQRAAEAGLDLDIGRESGSGDGQDHQGERQSSHRLILCKLRSMATSADPPMKPSQNAWTVPVRPKG